MKRDDGLHMVKGICLALMMAAILVLGVGCGSTGSSEPVGEEPEVHEESEQSGQPAGDASVYSAYREVLLENESVIRDYYWQLDSNNELYDEYTFDDNGNVIPSDQNTNKCIAFTDINDDGIEEMLFMSADDVSFANLHIYTYDAEMHEAVEIVYDCKTQYGSELGYMSDIYVAGGSRYMVFTGTEPEYALEVCNAVLDVWQPTADRKAIINLPVTVEMSMPHVYAMQVAYMNKHLKISTFLRKWWGNVVFLEGTDKSYIAQILSYTQDAEHDDAPDSAACVARYYDRKSGQGYNSPFGG